MDNKIKFADTILGQKDAKKTFQTLDENFQLSVLKYFIEDVSFLSSLYTLIKPDYFSYAYQKEMLELILVYYEKNKKTPTSKEIKAYVKLSGDVFYKDEIIMAVSRFNDLEKEFRKEFVIEKTLGLFKSQEMIKAFVESLPLVLADHSQQNWDIIFEKIKDAYNACSINAVGHNYKDDVLLRYPNEEEADLHRGYTGIMELDAMMSGGVPHGNIFVVTGAPGMGKSIFLTNVGYSNMMMNKNVWHVTLEMDWDITGRRYDSRHTGIPMHQLNARVDEIQRRINSEIQGNMYISKYSEYSMSPESLLSEYDRLLAMDFKPDVMILDYPDLMIAKKGGSIQVNSDNIYNALGIIYAKMRAMGKELGFSIFAASQVNREGLKAGGALNNLADVSDSSKKTFSADVWTSLRRTDDQILANRAELVIKKNRLGPANITLPLQNYNMGTCYFELDTNSFNNNDLDQNIRQTILDNSSERLFTLRDHVMRNSGLRDIIQGITNQREAN